MGGMPIGGIGPIGPIGGIPMGMPIGGMGGIGIPPGMEVGIPGGRPGGIPGACGVVGGPGESVRAFLATGISPPSAAVI